ncbi:RraA family protein [Sphingosinicella sp. LHD-64]|uniref:RraA family protein n=1 Tax=Sphingosinicella sp. LHD-64 TaxID=3072139 RepID=UPI0028102487|nr:RraA family protein [Sphingosinicella sp. LHD-64]MDQ8756531.1 RraA family protein [Sphingosinicella sp. LHD-64]
MSDAIAERLAKLDACAVSDALDQLGLPASITGLGPLAARRRIAGRIITVKLAAGKPPEGAPARHLCTTAIDTAEPGNVIVVEQRTGVECAGWGGILSNAAKVKGLSGVIVEGLARDVDEAADIGFAVYARGATARTARGRIHEASTGEPVTVGDVTVSTGDYVVADGSGAAFIPAARIADVLAAAEAIAAKEAGMTQAVLAGHAVSTIMGAGYEHLLEGKTEA